MVTATYTGRSGNVAESATLSRPGLHFVTPAIFVFMHGFTVKHIYVF